MARLRVGDIVIDGQRIEIGGQQLTPAASARPAAPPTSERSLAHAAPERSTAATLAVHREQAQNLARFRGPPQYWMGGGAALAVLGALLVALTGAPNFLAYFFQGGMLIPAGLGFIVIGWLKQQNQRALAEVTRREEDRRLEPICQRVLGLLRNPPSGVKYTVEQIIARTEVGEALVVRALVRLRNRGEVREELDLDSGEWYYVVGAGENARDLDARLVDLERNKRS